MESNYTYSLFFKHSPLLFSILFFVSGIHGYLGEDSVTINDELTELSLTGLIFLSSLSFLFVLLWNYLRQRLIRVRLGGQNITVIDEEKNVIPWVEVNVLKRVPFIAPPLYKIRFEDEGLTYLFLTNPFYLNFGFGIWDMSKMGHFIRGKKRKLNL